MGYRNYLSYIPKRVYNKIRTQPIEELKKMAIESAEVRGKMKSYVGIYDDDNDYVDSEVKHMINQELIEQHLVELHNLGKGVDLGAAPKKSTRNFFTKKESNLIVCNCDTDMMIVTKEFFKHVIELYVGYIQTFYKDMKFERDEYRSILEKMERIEHDDWEREDDYKLKPDQELTQTEITKLLKCADHVRMNAIEWLQNTPFKLDDDDDSVSRSWKYEYAIFQLVHLYKTFDWKRNYLVYSGH